MKFCPSCRQTYATSQRYCLEDGELLSLKDPYHLLGTTLSEKYRLDALIGVGGMGAVYNALHVGIERRVAVKILLPHLSLHNQQLTALFEREAKIAGRLAHENIVDVKDAGHTPDGITYLVMEWLEGRTLDEALSAEGQLSLERAGAIMRQIAAALAEAHSKHIIHRDLKPSNVMLVHRPDGERVKVLDFGIGKVLNDTVGSPVSGVMGTPQYASPEQFNLGGRIDSRTDIYSLGVMLYEMLGGALPFKADSVRELIQMHLAAPPPPLRLLRPDIPPAVEGLVYRMLEKDPDRRPQSVGEVAAQLDLALEESKARPTAGIASPPATTTVRIEAGETAPANRTTHSVPDALDPTNSAPAPSTQPAAQPAETDANAGRRSTLLYLGIGLALFVVSVLWLLLILLRPDEDPSPNPAEPSPEAQVIEESGKSAVQPARPTPSVAVSPTSTPRVTGPIASPSPIGTPDPRTEAGKSTTIAGRWIIYGDNTVLDSRTGLMWMKKDYRVIEGRFVKGWGEAMAWPRKINAQRYAGYNDWRVPSIAEYKSIIDRAAYPQIFESMDEQCYWSRNEINRFVASYIYMRGEFRGAAVSGSKDEGASPKALFKGPFSVRLVRQAR